MIQFNKAPGQRILELGCGANRNPASDVAVDVRPGRGVDFAVNLAEPDWPIGSDEFDAVLSVFCLEHIPYPAVPTFLAEAKRVLKPGGRAVILIPNTEAQLKWILAHPDGWDGKGLFASASCKLFGDQEHGKRLGAEDAGVDSHKAYFNPAIAVELFNSAGFEGVIVAPFGERATDMIVEAKKPAKADVVEREEETAAVVDRLKGVVAVPNQLVTHITQAGVDAGLDKMFPTAAKPTPPYEPAKLFNRQYFDFGGLGYPMGYMDFPQNELIVRHVLARKPQSVLELGCGRGYLLKKLQDFGVPASGVDVSRHCHLTRVCLGTYEFDLTKTPWGKIHSTTPGEEQQIDLCFSFAFLEHIPEDQLPVLFTEMRRTTKRGLHGVSMVANGHDNSQVTIKPRSWWVERMPAGHEVVDVNELRAGKLPPEYFRSASDLVKLNVGSYLSMTHRGWFNIDQHDLTKFAQANGFNFQQRDVRQGLIQSTGTVDLLFAHHFLEHLDYRDGLSFLRECRRVLKPETGALRIVVPDSEFLNRCYIRGDDSYDLPKLSDFDEMNGGCAEAKTPAAKLHALLQGGDHRAFYDAETLVGILEDAGFVAWKSDFRSVGREGILRACHRDAFDLMLRECLEMSYGGSSLFVNAIPKVG